MNNDKRVADYSWSDLAFVYIHFLHKRDVRVMFCQQRLTVHAETTLVEHGRAAIMQSLVKTGVVSSRRDRRDDNVYRVEAKLLGS